MPTNKHAMIRYQTLDKCFSNPGRKYFIEDLVEECSNAITEFTGNESGIKRRQVLEDIKFMESAQGWNISLERKRDGHKVYFRYEDRKFSINNQPLNETEENQLKEALLTLSRFKGMPQFEWIDEITARLDSGLKLSGAKGKIIEFDQNFYLKGVEFITPLYNAILYKQVLSISYQSFRKETAHTIILHPYFLKQFNNRWYVFGRDNANGFIINLALDRIISLQESKLQYVPNESLDFETYFEDVIGVTVNNKEVPANIKLRVSNNLYPYIETKPIHGSQKVKERGKAETIITLDLIPNYELESLILSFGEGIEVLEPNSLRDKIKERINRMGKNYKKKNAD